MCIHAWGACSSVVAAPRVGPAAAVLGVQRVHVVVVVHARPAVDAHARRRAEGAPRAHAHLPRYNRDAVEMQVRCR